MITEKRKEILIAACKDAFANETSVDMFRVGLTDEENEFLEDVVEKESILSYERKRRELQEKFKEWEEEDKKRNRELLLDLIPYVVAGLFLAYLAIFKWSEWM